MQTKGKFPQPQPARERGESGKDKTTRREQTRSKKQNQRKAAFWRAQRLGQEIRAGQPLQMLPSGEAEKISQEAALEQQAICRDLYSVAVSFATPDSRDSTADVSFVRSPSIACSFFPAAESEVVWFCQASVCMPETQGASKDHFQFLLTQIQGTARPTSVLCVLLPLHVHSSQLLRAKWSGSVRLPFACQKHRALPRIIFSSC